jgi:putative N6-adenine-specific DNA methylase
MKPIDPNKRAATRIACARHLTPWARHELESLGFEIQAEDALGVQVGASLIECLALALQLRTASHVLWQLARFRCPTVKALKRDLAAIAWEEIIPLDGYFTVRSSVTHPSIDNDLYANRLAKDIIADRFTERFGQRPDSGPERRGVVIHFHWHEERVTVYLNINGRPLSDRGYRKLPHAAPMRETLAAAVLMASGYDGTTALINPMCGSGTLAIEAALIATGRAPGLLRGDYAVLHTALDLESVWREARADAKRNAAPRANPLPPIIASDHDPHALDAAQRNAAVAGVDHLIQFVQCDFTRTPMPRSADGGTGHIILNPEYGERMGENEALERTYALIGDFFKQHCAGWQGHVFTGSRELAKRIGLRPARRTPFMNGPIECRLLSFDVYEGRLTGPHVS